MKKFELEFELEIRVGKVNPNLTRCMTHVILVGTSQLPWPGWKNRQLKRSVFQRSVKRNQSDDTKRRHNEIPGRPNTLLTNSNKLIQCRFQKKRKSLKRKFLIFSILKKSQIILKIRSTFIL